MNPIAAAFTTNARAQLIERLWLNTQISREQIFGSADRLPHGARSDARDMWAGYVGPRYRPGGLVLVARYPAGGTVAYPTTARAARDESFYELISAFKRANSVSRAAAFEALNRHVAKALLPQWKIYKIVRVVLEAAGVSLDEVAYINLVPYQIADNKTPSANVVKAAWAECTAPALAALQPGMVAALGKASGRDLAARSVAPLYVFRRTNGDTYVHPEAHEAARLLAAARGAPTPAGDAARKPQASVATARARSRARPSAATSKLRGSGLGRRPPRPQACTG